MYRDAEWGLESNSPNKDFVGKYLCDSMGHGLLPCIFSHEFQ